MSSLHGVSILGWKVCWHSVAVGDAIDVGVNCCR